MGQWSHLYNNTAWRKRRKAQLEREPLCRYCAKLGKVVVATVADHIEPHKGDMVKFRGELQSLCKTCHNSAKAIEEGRGVVIGCDMQGNPVGREW